MWWASPGVLFGYFIKGVPKLVREHGPNQGGRGGGKGGGGRGEEGEQKEIKHFHKSSKLTLFRTLHGHKPDKNTSIHNITS